MNEERERRDRQRCNVQVVVGVVMVSGWPIAHHVWEGNRRDTTTVEEVVKDLTQRFDFRRVVFVGDRGMVSGGENRHPMSRRCTIEAVEVDGAQVWEAKWLVSIFGRAKRRGKVGQFVGAVRASGKGRLLMTRPAGVVP